MNFGAARKSVTMTEATIRGQKGMTSVKELPVLQDGPPPGGFPAVRYARRIVNTGPSGATVLLVSSAIIGWGMYQVGQGNIHRRFAWRRISFEFARVANVGSPRSFALISFFFLDRGLKAEKIAARQAILPLIQAEEDARFDSSLFEV